MNAVKPAGHLKEMRNELPRGKLWGIKNIDENLSQRCHLPNVFLGGPVPVSFGFPIEAFGNDGIQEVWKKLLRSKVRGIKPAEIIKMSNNSITGMPFFKYGKVKDIYDLGDRLLIVASDRLSCFDVVLPTKIPSKGKILTALSAYWFREMEDIAGNRVG